MFDTTTPDEVPANPEAVAGYVTGFVDYAELVARFPHAHHLSITIDASADADVLDVEPGAASPSDVAGWVDRQRARGHLKPYIYGSISNLPTVLAGIHRSQVFVWSAHYTFHPHICAPNTCGADGTGITADATQYTNAYDGLNVDASLCHTTFFVKPKPVPPPLPPDPHHYRWFPSSAKGAHGLKGGPWHLGGKELDERAVVEAYDHQRILFVPAPHKLKGLEEDLGLLATRVWTVAHEQAHNGHIPWNDDRRLGWRYQELKRRSEGHRVAT